MVTCHATWLHLPRHRPPPTTSEDSRENISTRNSVMESELVEMEIDAARALAEFASAARRESGGWGATGRRRRRTGVGGSSFDLNREANTEEEHNHLQHDENAVEGRPEQFVHKEEEHNHLDYNDEDGREGRTTHQISVKQEETWQSTPSCSSSWLSSTPGRTKLELTEAEKEEKRLRRILSNRESARQTIRRRQALCEELKTKAAALSLDNEKMKREKELALREYFLLYEANQKLNEKMAERLKAARSTQLELGTNGSTKNPLWDRWRYSL